jgi:hypothetical protein
MIYFPIVMSRLVGSRLPQLRVAPGLNMRSSLPEPCNTDVSTVYVQHQHAQPPIARYTTANSGGPHCTYNDNKSLQT